MPKTHGWPKKLLLILFWILIWQICSMAVKSQILLVGPLETLRSFSVQLFLPDFWAALGFSFGRICLGFFLAFFAGLVTGACAYWKPLIGEFLDPPIQFMKSIPVASFVILALFWTGAENLSIFISFIVVYPMIHVNTLAGLLSADPKLLEMAKVFRLPHGPRLEAGRLYLPRRPLSVSEKRLPDGIGNGAEVRNRGRGHRSSRRFHRRRTLFIENLFGYGGSVCLDDHDHLDQRDL